MIDRQQLLNVIQGEAMARCRYEIYAEIARSEGLHYYAKIFEETARNELSHLKELYTLAGLIDITTNNLSQSIENESKESSLTYPKLQEDALIDNDLNTARLFQQITKIETRHKERFEKLLQLLNDDKAFKRDTTIIWKCRICGYIHEGFEPPAKCPACQSPYNYFEPDDFSI